jgi:hypothetical protein
MLGDKLDRFEKIYGERNIANRLFAPYDDLNGYKIH